MSDEQLNINKSNLTIMGVKFPNERVFSAAVGAVGSSIIEGYVPSKSSLERIIDRYNKRSSRV